MAKKRKRSYLRGLSGSPAMHEEGAQRYMRESAKALREGRPCAALHEAHKAEVEVSYASPRAREYLLDELAGLIGEAGSACPCKNERVSRR